MSLFGRALTKRVFRVSRTFRVSCLSPLAIKHTLSDSFRRTLRDQALSFAKILFQRLDDCPVGCEQGSAMSLVLALRSALRASLRTRTDLALENLALLRQQLVRPRRRSKATAIGASMDEKIRFRKRSLRPARQGSSGPFSFLSTASLGARTDAFLQANPSD